MPALHLAIDASRITRAQRTGTENYALQIILHLLAQNQGTQHAISLYFRDTPSAELQAELLDHAPVPTLRIVPFWRMWTHLRFAAELWRTRPDVSFVPAHSLPRSFPGPAVVTIHDLGYLHFPSAHPTRTRRYLDWSTRWSVRRATRVIAISEATRQDLMTHYQVPPEKIVVVHHGIDPRLQAVTKPQVLTRIKHKYHLPERYWLFVGTLHPRKNIQRLVAAYQQWQQRAGNSEVGLVLAGQKGWLFDDSWLANTEGIKLTGYIDEADLAAVYSGSVGLVFPSLYEGFGLPVLEAMQCGIPVICSNTSSLPELVGDSALMVNPLAVDEIAGAMLQLWQDESLRQNLIGLGKAHVRQFTWQHAAEKTMQILEEAASPGR